MADKLRITLVKSTIGAVPKNKKTAEALGLTKLNKTVEMPDNAEAQKAINELNGAEYVGRAMVVKEALPRN